MAEVMKEAVDLKDEKRIQELCLKAFATNHPKDLKAYYQAASKYFQDRHYRRMAAAEEMHEVVAMMAGV